MSQELGAEARALLARARRSSDPSASDHWAVRRGVAKQIARVGAASAALTAGISTSKAGATLAGGLKLALLSQFGLATVAGATLATSAMFIGEKVIDPDPPSAVSTTIRQHRAAAPSHSAPSARALEPLLPLEGVTPKPPSPAASFGSEARLEIRADPGERKLPTTNGEISTSKAERTAARKPTRQILADREAHTQAESTAPTALRDEGRALAQVQSALSEHRGADALRLLELHGKSFEGGALAQERAAARIFALCELGRRGEARAAAEGFAHAWPDSPLLGRVLTTCK